MEESMEATSVMLQCSCGVISPIVSTYFCRWCIQFRCKLCVDQELLQCFCDNCFFIVSSSVAHFNKGQCSTCYNCPNCLNHLTLYKKRNKLYYLACSFCQWSTHEISFPNQVNISSFYSAPENKRVQDLIQYYRAIYWKQTESSYQKFCVGDSLSTKHMISTKSKKLRSNTISLLTQNVPINIPHIKPAVAEENKDVLLFDTQCSYTCLLKLTTVNQRLADPEIQPNEVADFQPLRSNLVSKSLIKCQVCQHNLRIPESDNSKNYFKVNRNCNYYVPSLKVLRHDPLRYDALSELVMEITNCFKYYTTVTFSQNFETPKCILRTALKKNVDVITLPESPQILTPKNAKTEITSSLLNGVQIRFLVQPNILASAGEDAVLSFNMQYSYLCDNSLISEVKKVESKIFINLGKLDTF